MDKIIDKIRKLLAKAKDSGVSEHEAEAFLSKANELMLRHGIDMLEAEQVPTAVIGSFHSKPIKVWNVHENLLANSIAYLFNCRTLYTRRKNDDHLRFVGLEANIVMTTLSFDYIVDQCNALYKIALKVYRQEKAVDGEKMVQSDYDRFGSSFKRAFAERVAYRIYQIKNASKQEPGKALLVIDQEMAAANAVLQDKGVKPRKHIAMHRGGPGTAAGDVAGRVVKIQQEVEA